ncbi:MAG: sulfatase-like hydrolase/transferase, partial [Myxococcota bacterium]|nr:sulfatase-like hydrolase/transferase [Myxococcota bacterium]
ASYADMFMGIFFEELDRRGLLDETVIVVTSDHGEGLGEQGIFEHGFHMSDEVLRVPLMIRLPKGRNGGHRVQAPVALLDVMPTLLEMGQARPPAGIHGGTLSSYLDGGDGTGRPVVYSEGYIRSISAWSSVGRLTFTGVGADSQFLGDLLEATPLDSIAYSTSTARSPEVLEALRQETLTWRRSLSPRPRTGNENTAVIESMQKRGYWGSP